MSPMSIVLCVSFVLILAGVLVSSFRRRVTATQMSSFGRDEIIIVNFSDGTEEKYRGSCTVWYSWPGGRRQSTNRERWLSNIWQKHKWEREDS